MEIKCSITIFTRVRLCTVSWVNVHIPDFSRTENYYRVCAEGMSLFSIKQKRFDVKRVTIRYFRSLTSKDERTKCKNFLSSAHRFMQNIIFWKVPMLLPVVLEGQNVHKDECGVLIERFGHGKTEVLEELSVPLPLCPSFSSYREVGTPLPL